MELLPKRWNRGMNPPVGLAGRVALV